MLKNTINYNDSKDPQVDPREEPYRLYTTDHFDDKFNYHSLYGVIPIMHARKDGDASTNGFFWSNSSDTFVDIFND